MCRNKRKLHISVQYKSSIENTFKGVYSSWKIRNFETQCTEFLFSFCILCINSMCCYSDACVTTEDTYTCRGTYRFTHSIVPARLSVCKPYIQLNRSSSRGGGYPRRWCHCARAVGSDSGSAWLNEKLSGLYIRVHHGVLVMQNSHTNWISPGDASLSFMELSPARRVGERMFDVTFGD